MNKVNNQLTMVNVPTKAVLNRINVDSVERYIVYAASVLKLIYTQHENDLINNKTVQIAHKINGEDNSVINIAASFPLDFRIALSNGGGLLKSIYNFDYNHDFEVTYTCLPSTINQEKILNFLSTNTESLEQAFYLACCLLKALNKSGAGSITIESFLDATPHPRVDLKISLPFIPEKYLINGNYTCSVKEILPQLDNFTQNESIFDISNSIINNSAEINNNIAIGN